MTPTYRYSHSALSTLVHCPQKIHTGPPRMQQTEFTGEYGRRGIHREWRNTEGQPHRTTGPAVERWTVLPSGAHVLSKQAWYQNGKLHREGRHAYRRWDVADDGTWVLVSEMWQQHRKVHRVGGPSYRSWHVQPDGTRTLALESWRVNGKLHRVDGPALDGRAGPGFYWHGVSMSRGEDLPWVRRGQGILAALAGPEAASPRHDRGGEVGPTWTRDARVAPTHATPPASPTYRSAVGGVVLLCV